MGVRDLISKVENDVNKKLHPTTNSSTQPPPRSTKRGLCWPVENQEDIFPFTRPGSKISWLYNWSPTPPSTPSSLSFIPMHWNHMHSQSHPFPFPTPPPPEASFLLAFNEPDLPSQANMSPALAAETWLTHIEPLRKRNPSVRCGSPAISNAPEGVPWLQDFLQRIRAGGGDVDFYCLHWYGETLGQFYDYIWSTHHRLAADKPVWITEFAATNWNPSAPLPREHVESFARESVKYLDSLDWVERYCWFGPMRDVGTVGKGARMFDDQGKLTPLGKAYRDD